MYLIDKQIVKTVMVYIDHNGHNHINNACTSQEEVTCFITVIG